MYFNDYDDTSTLGTLVHVDIQHHQLHVEALVPLISGTNALLELHQFHILFHFQTDNLSYIVHFRRPFQQLPPHKL